MSRSKHRRLLVARACLACLCIGCAHARTTLAARQQGFRAQPPPLPPAPALRLPSFIAGTASNGMRVLVSEQHAQPIVDIEIAFAAGSASDPPQQAGLAELTYDMMLAGAGSFDAAALDAAFAMLGRLPRLEVDADGARLGVAVLKENAAAALRLLALTVLQPRFTEASFERRKAQQQADLAELASEPSYLAKETFLARAFGSDHPYGHDPRGTCDDLARIDLPAVRDFYATHVGPATLAVVMTGDIELVHALELVNAQFGSFGGAAARDPAPRVTAPMSARPIYYVERPGLDQTTLWVGRPALAAGDSQEAALEIAVAAMGGMFSSRLNLTLRDAALAHALDAATQREVDEAADEYLQPAWLTLVAVGDPQVLAEQLSRVELDPPRTLSLVAAAC